MVTFERQEVTVTESADATLDRWKGQRRWRRNINNIELPVLKAASTTFLPTTPNEVLKHDRDDMGVDAEVITVQEYANSHRTDSLFSTL